MAKNIIKFTYTLPCDSLSQALLIKGYIRGLEFFHNEDDDSPFYLKAEFDMSDFEEVL